MPDACWKKGNSPYGKSYDNRGNVCSSSTTVEIVEASIVLGLLGAVLIVLAIGWIVRYSRRASRFRAFWNQSPVHSHPLGSTTSFETHELKAGMSSPSSSTLRNSASAESLSLRAPKYAVPRSTSRPASIVGSPPSLGSRRSSTSGSASPALRPLSIAAAQHPPTRSSPLASGQPKPSLSARPNAARSPLASNSGSGSSEDGPGERGAFLAGMGSRQGVSMPEATYGSGGLSSPGVGGQGEFGAWDSGGYHLSSPGAVQDPYHPPPSPTTPTSYLPQPAYAAPPEGPHGLALRSASPTPSVGQIFHHPPPPHAQAYRPSTPTRQAPDVALHSPLDRLSFAHPNAQPPPPTTRMFSESSDVSGFYSPPASPGMNFSRPSSRTDGRG